MSGMREHDDGGDYHWRGEVKRGQKSNVPGYGFLSQTRGQGGPDLGFYYRPWQLGVSAQAGYGNAHQYGQISMYKPLSWFE